MQILGETRERSHRFRIAIGRYGYKDFRRSNIDAGGIGPHHRQIPIQLPILFSLLLPWIASVDVRQRARRAKMGNLSSGIIAHKKRGASPCFGARAWDQTNERARRSK